jgi:hypothetical protein
MLLASHPPYLTKNLEFRRGDLAPLAHIHQLLHLFLRDVLRAPGCGRGVCQSDAAPRLSCLTLLQPPLSCASRVFLHHTSHQALFFHCKWGGGGQRRGTIPQNLQKKYRYNVNTCESCRSMSFFRSQTSWYQKLDYLVILRKKLNFFNKSQICQSRSNNKL